MGRPARALFASLCLSSAWVLLLAGCAKQQADGGQAQPGPKLKMGIAPYQEIALLVNEKPLGLEKKYQTNVELITMPWEELLPAVASAGTTIDVGFASLSDYLAKAKHLNVSGDDPILYLYPAWVFHGGGLITFNKDVPELTAASMKDPAVVKKFLSYKIGVQKNSCCHMLLWKLAHDNGLKLSNVKIIDTTLNDGLLAAENGSLDIAGAGLTQRTETIKQHGRVVLTMDNVGLMDPGGFVCKASMYKKRQREIDSLIKMWFDCTKFVMTDLDHHSSDTLAYLKANASTKYTLDEFKAALAQEFIPTSIEEAQKEVVTGKGKYSINKLSGEISDYLLETGATDTPVSPPKMITP
jgi:ABC-type nitrate/sulfonate/bicarbonate transport system substrate-binding protein